MKREYTTQHFFTQAYENTALQFAYISDWSDDVEHAARQQRAYILGSLYAIHKIKPSRHMLNLICSLPKPAFDTYRQTKYPRIKSQ